jgi:ATP-dependent DNA ligase I
MTSVRVPPHKLLPFGILVDGFKYADSPNAKAYFLTHAHSDHTTGLKDNWNLGPIYCSEITSRLIACRYPNVDPSFFSPLPLSTPTPIQIGPHSVTVTLIDANHCPGAVQFLFSMPDGTKCIHTGDFRYSPLMLDDPHLLSFRNCNAIYLDTTYCSPKHCFPTQQESIDYVSRVIKEDLEVESPLQDFERKTLYVISTYSIGKERILQAVHQATGLPLYVSDRRADILACLDDLPPSSFTTDATATPIHVTNWGVLGETWPYFKPNFTSMEELRQQYKAERVVGFVPTGWLYEMKKETFSVRTKDACSIHLVPYSEHSSYRELTEYVGWIRPHKIIPTVGVDGVDGEKNCSKMLNHFRNLVDETSSKRKFLASFHINNSNSKGAGGGGGGGGGDVERIDINDDNDEVVVVAVSEDDVDDHQVPGPSSSNQDENKPAIELQEMLLQILGEDVPLQHAQQLMKDGNGDINRAVNMHIDGTVNRISSGSGSSRKKKRRQSNGAQGVQQSIFSFFGGGGGNSSEKKKCKEEEKKTVQTMSPTTTTTTTNKQPLLSPPPPPPPPPSASATPKKESTTYDTSREAEAAVPKDFTTLPLDECHPINPAPFLPPPPHTSTITTTDKNNQLQQSLPLPYLHIARSLEAMDSTTKRLRIGDVLTNMFRSIIACGTTKELIAAAYLVCGEVAPPFHPDMELSVGGSTVMAAVSEVTGVNRRRLRELYVQYGDPGDVAAACRKSQSVLKPPPQLTIVGVYNTLVGIAGMKGGGAVGRRKSAVAGLLRACRESSETRYLVRTLVRSLRVGASWRSVVPALGRATLCHQRSNSNGGSMDVPSKVELDGVAAAATAAFQICPDLSLLIEQLHAGPAETIAERCKPQIGVPIKPMLARPCNGFADAAKLIQKATTIINHAAAAVPTTQHHHHNHHHQQHFLAERKYDGVRAQIHLNASSSDHKVTIFSRNLEDRTKSFPDVVAIIQAAVQQQSPNTSIDTSLTVILDAELVAVDRADNNRQRPFQELSSRSRGEVSSGNIIVDVCVYVFDMLHRGDESLLELPLSKRREALVESVRFKEGSIQLAESSAVDVMVPTMVEQEEKEKKGGEKQIEKGEEQGNVTTKTITEPATTSIAVLEAVLKHHLLDACAGGTEGLILKPLNAPYEPSKRSDNWLKLKKDYCDGGEDGLGDTLDLVPIGAWWGQGRKKSWFSPFLMAVWDPEREELQSICRCMSGFSDEFYEAATARLKERIVTQKKPYYNTNESCAVWFDATEVWEVRGADLQLSPVHCAGIGKVEGLGKMSGRGIGLRFPRFIKIREDKEVEEATQAEVVADMYYKQSIFQQGGKGGGGTVGAREEGVKNQKKIQDDGE